MKTDNLYRCGYVALIGRPNVGKSTLMNHILRQKISITSRKPQTTRHRILGVKTTNTEQVIYVDTPGIHVSDRAMNRYMNKSASSILHDVDLILFLLDADKWTEEDDNVLVTLKNSTVPVIVLLNKIDKIQNKESILPLIDSLSKKMDYKEIIPISATKGINVKALQKSISQYLKVSEPYFPEDQITDKSERFMSAEIVREKLMRELGQELPYDITVEIEKYEVKEKITKIAALIWVSRNSQKPIVIGKNGVRLKSIGQKARIDIQKLIGSKVFLELWVKVKEGWADDDRALKSLGYVDD
ncbi:GTP-binding protein Era [hydrothermal vent metagenome]|uniref:GTP-binding protein Era n=1 Tax=hydrothermal vent metagenome TaxID=652676 RepID=A0A3B1A1B5_9ZZZZ